VAAAGARAVPGWPKFDAEQTSAVLRVLESGRVNYWTGDECRHFEQEFAAACGVRHGIALANGSVALEIALRALGIGPGDEVVVTSTSFVASASCVPLVGATPVFADVDGHSGNITPKTVAAVLSPRTKAIIAVHLAGWPCDMAGLRSLAKERGIYLIEDCAQAHGARIGTKMAGSFGDIAAFSFCQDKIMTTGGEGGMVLTDRDDLQAAMWSLKDHGKSYAKVQQPNPTAEFRFLHDSFGSNYRMTEMQAAIGRVQLTRLTEWVDLRRRNAGIYTAALGNLPGVEIPSPPADTYHSYYKFYLLVRPDRLRPGCSRDRLRKEINARGVPCFSGTCAEIYLEQCFQKAGFGPASPLPASRERGLRTLMFLVHPTLKVDDVQWMADTARSAITQATADA